ncbi:MAG: hypothetical protein FJW38_18525 [Acidobacteria bacterium]|nr:hypothetical protein [Acidobacteriota bacterium]
MSSEFLAVLLAFAVLAVLRDAVLLAQPTGAAPRKAFQVGLPVAAFLIGGEVADRLSPAQTMGLLHPTPVWASLLAIHALLAAWISRRSDASPLPLLSLWAGPCFFAFAIMAPAVLLQNSAMPSGLLAGAVSAAAYSALAGAGMFLFRSRRFASDRVRELLAVSHLSTLLLLPFPGEAGLTMNSIHDLLYILSNAFLFPTLIGTLVAFAYGTWVVGRFLADLADHRHNAAAIRQLMEGEPTQERFLALPLRADWKRLQAAVRQHTDFPAMIDKTVADLEHAMHGRAERLGIMSKVGPMLGLIGTLIPLQPALAGLAKGDMQAMGANLQIGFTTTVLGLLVGGACYAVGVVMRGWYQQDVTDMHFLLALWLPNDSNRAATAPAYQAFWDASHNPRLEEVRLDSK